MRGRRSGGGQSHRRSRQQASQFGRDAGQMASGPAAMIIFSAVLAQAGALRPGWPSVAICSSLS